MKYFIAGFAMLVNSIVATAQHKNTDTLLYVRAKRMSDADLAKKKEGLFITAIPDVSSDPVTGWGFGARTNIYQNGTRSHQLFAYTPYLYKVKLNATWYTSNARELVLGFDMPYVRGSRWRVKVDFKAQQNPTNLYFGNTEQTLAPLRILPYGPTYNRFADYDAARKSIRIGGIGEAPIVTDALMNRFEERELMLNLKADRALGSGRWRVLGGYEIQHLGYSTFEGFNSKVTIPVTGGTTEVPNGLSLLQRDYVGGKVYGLDGGWISLVQGALIYDTRDLEPDPSRGMYAEATTELSDPVIGSGYSFAKVMVQGKFFRKLPVGPRTIAAARVAVGNIFGNKAPFFEFQDQWSPDGSINALGGRQSLRGYRANRFLARSLAFANLEVRARLGETRLLKQRFSLTAVPFFDVGTVRNDWKDLNLTQWKYSWGGGLRIGWNQSTILSFDYGLSPEDRLFFFGIGQIF